MLTPNHRKRRGDVVLGVVVSDGAVTLRLSNVVGEREGGRGWSAHRAWRGVVGGGPTQLCQIIAREKWRPSVDEAASSQTHVESGRGCKGVIQVHNEQLAVVELRATVLTETGS